MQNFEISSNMVKIELVKKFFPKPQNTCFGYCPICHYNHSPTYHIFSVTLEGYIQLFQHEM